jgi:hypothetical protein
MRSSNFSLAITIQTSPHRLKLDRSEAVSSKTVRLSAMIPKLMCTPLINHSPYRSEGKAVPFPQEVVDTLLKIGLIFVLIDTRVLLEPRRMAS